jgi:cytochrome c oxidase cbb3-type subunit 2
MASPETRRSLAREDRDQQLPDDRADPRGHRLWRAGRDRAAVLPEVHHGAGEGVKPYTALQLAGRDVYLREGCYNCHSQMIRPFRAETLRYGHVLGRRRVRLRPPVPVGQQAHRARPAPRRRTLLRRLAPRAPGQPARRGARVQHACLPLAGQGQRGPADMVQTAHARAAHGWAVPYTDEEIAKAGDEVKGKTEMEALIAYLQVHGHCPQVRHKESRHGHQHPALRGHCGLLPGFPGHLRLGLVSPQCGGL